MGREERRRRRVCVHASSVRVNRKEKSGASALIRGEEPVRRVVIGRLRLVVASDLLEAVAPPLVYAGPRVRGRRASSLKTASFVAFTCPHCDRGEVSSIERIASRVWAAATNWNTTNAHYTPSRNGTRTRKSVWQAAYLRSMNVMSYRYMFSVCKMDIFDHRIRGVASSRTNWNSTFRFHRTTRYDRCYLLSNSRYRRWVAIGERRIRMTVYSKVKFDRGGGERRFSSISSIADGGRW